MKNKLSQIICILFSMASGSIITIMIKKISSLTISNEVNLLDLIFGISTVIITLYIAFILEKNKGDERNSKDSIISFYKEYYEFLQNKIEKILSNELEYQEILSEFKILRMKWYELKSIDLSKKILGENERLIEEISSEINNLWEICTEDENIIDGRVIERAVENIRIKLVKIEISIYKLILKINEY